jgi:hypothetical protein
VSNEAYVEFAKEAKEVAAKIKPNGQKAGSE